MHQSSIDRFFASVRILSLLIVLGACAKRGIPVYPVGNCDSAGFGSACDIQQGSNYLFSGASLTVGTSLASYNGNYRLSLQEDGNLVLYGPSGAIWATYTTSGHSAVMQEDGNFVLYDSSGKALFSTETYGNASSKLNVNDDGALALISGDGRVLWNNAFGRILDRCATLAVGESLLQNQSIASCDGKYFLSLLKDGNLVVVGPAGVQWNAKVSGGARLTMQGDGNLVLYHANNQALWASNTGGRAASNAVLQDDGNLVLFQANGTIVWSLFTGLFVGR